eukprot:GFUD01007197.1.p1 GENE.GFUD01007197.1~~GFUD01007197.1.p1  ORF type:complete len:178 (+),score=66.87 GFUD01007197.1:213-746(+)
MELGGLLDESVAGEDYYSVLGCHPSSTEEQILTEYRIRAKENHPDKEGSTEDFQSIQEAKETLLNKAKRTLYDKWRSAGIGVSFKQWESMKETVQTSMHWATPKNERMLPEGEERQTEPEKENELEENEDVFKENVEHKEKKMTPKLARQDSSHPTIVMINKCNHEDLRKKFRNYEI